MIVGKFWAAFRAQVNKLANFFWTADPIAQMQYEYDLAVDAAQGRPRGAGAVSGAGRARDPAGGRTTSSTCKDLESKVKAYLQAGDRETAAKFALELQKAKQELAENEGQLKMHEEAYNNNVTKIKHATGKLGEDSREDRQVRRRAEDEQGRGRDGQAGRELQLRRHHRLRPDRAGDPGQDRPEPRQGPRRGRPVERRHRRYPARASDGEGDGRPGPASSSKWRWAWSRPRRPT